MTADLLAALRQLRRCPRHVVVSTLSLGIGMAMLTPLSMLLAVGILAAVVPAYRAATVDPIGVLREP